MNKFNILFLLTCLVLIPLEKGYAQKNDVLYMRFDENNSGMDIIKFGESTYFQYKMIDEGDSYKKAILKYAGKKWDGEYMASENTFVLFKVDSKLQPKVISLCNMKNYESKNIKWLRRKYFNHFLEAKNGSAKNIYLFHKKNEDIYIAQIDSVNQQATLTKVTYNPPISY